MENYIGKSALLLGWNQVERTPSLRPCDSLVLGSPSLSRSRKTKRRCWPKPRRSMRNTQPSELEQFRKCSADLEAEHLRLIKGKEATIAELLGWAMYNAAPDWPVEGVTTRRRESKDVETVDNVFYEVPHMRKSIMVIGLASVHLVNLSMVINSVFTEAWLSQSPDWIDCEIFFPSSASMQRMRMPIALRRRSSPSENMSWVPDGMYIVVVQVGPYVKFTNNGRPEYHVTRNLNWILDKDATYWTNVLADINDEVKHSPEQDLTRRITTKIWCQTEEADPDYDYELGSDKDDDDLAVDGVEGCKSVIHITDVENPKIAMGVTFEDGECFKRCIKKHTILKEVGLAVPYCDMRRYRAHYKAKRCSMITPRNLHQLPDNSMH
uniref:Transposase MuDR plant domain-containing protein n=1 Tax=Oryza brachyantha TaxID=4533 RepID=J3LW90_ORYBR